MVHCPQHCCCSVLTSPSHLHAPLAHTWLAHGKALSLPASSSHLPVGEHSFRMCRTVHSRLRLLHTKFSLVSRTNANWELDRNHKIVGWVSLQSWPTRTYSRLGNGKRDVWISVGVWLASVLNFSLWWASSFLRFSIAFAISLHHVANKQEATTSMCFLLKLCHCQIQHVVRGGELMVGIWGR